MCLNAVSWSLLIVHLLTPVMINNVNKWRQTKENFISLLRKDMQSIVVVFEGEFGWSPLIPAVVLQTKQSGLFQQRRALTARHIR